MGGVPQQVADKERAAEEAMTTRQVAESQPAPAPVEPQTPASASAAPAAAHAEEHADDATYERRYQALRGKYDAEVPRLHKDLRELRSMVMALNQQLEDAKPKVPPHLKHLTEDERGRLDESQVDLNARVARGEVENAVDPVKRDLENVKAQLVEMRNVARWNAIEALVPGSIRINAEAKRNGFADFLDQTVDEDGRTLRSVAEDAFDAADADKVAGIITQFIEKHGAPAPIQTRKPRQVSSPAPSTAGGKQGRIFKLSEINKIFADYTKGVYRGRLDEFAAIEKEIDKAQAEGRVVNG